MKWKDWPWLSRLANMFSHTSLKGSAHNEIAAHINSSTTTKTPPFEHFARWLDAPRDLDFEVKHCPGTTNGNANTLLLSLAR